jgi:hypothetical protein
MPTTHKVIKRISLTSKSFGRKTFIPQYKTPSLMAHVCPESVTKKSQLILHRDKPGHRGVLTWIKPGNIEVGKISVNWRQRVSMQDLRLSQQWLWRRPSSGMWCHVDLVWTDVSEENMIYTAPHPRRRHSSKSIYSVRYRSFIMIQANGLTIELIPHSRVILSSLRNYGTQSFITMFLQAHH